MCSSWSKPFVTSLTPGLLKQQYNGPKWKGNIWRYWTFDMYLILQKWLNSSFPPLWSVAFFLSRSLFFFSTINFLLSQSRFWLPGYFFFLVRNEWVGAAAADCTARSKEEQTDTAAPPARAVKALRLLQAQSMWFHNPASRTLSG